MRDDYLRVEAHACPMTSCAASAGSPCRTGKGKVAVQYHTARFRPVPALAKTTPPVRKPGTLWIELPRPAAAGTESAGHVRIGYARASTTRPELDKAVALARELRSAGVAVTLVVHEHKRLGRGLDLAALAEQLRTGSFLTGELQGSHDPSGVVFTVLAALSGMEREYIRDRTQECHESARNRLVITTGKKKGRHPSAATVLRMLRDHDEASATSAAAAG
ncbi:recombinase family protein [Nonomuraea sp. NPDC005650]|uniref:zinc finger domain-containing protein n=1 Tax=Nonomuraea sp. NPDC005650 TaxID=3157045 RepID=UPI0033B30125